MVFLIFLSIFAIVLATTSGLGDAAQKRLALDLARSEFEELSSKVAESCSLGNGNVRTVALSGGEASVHVEGRRLYFEKGAFFASRDFRCEITIGKESASSFRIENEGGTIEISGS